MVGPDGQPVVPGQSGELLVSGPGVARGYLGAPALTAERFVTDPVPGVSGRYYRTGDLVRRRNDGVLVFVGRADDQVKIRGYRIEPGEIERALVRHAGVREAVVLSDGQGDGRRLIAFVVPEGSLSMKELRTHAEAELPPFMVPSSMLQVGRIPAGEHGKRDIAALRALLVGYQARAEAYVAPSGRTEEYLAGLWSELLGVEQIGALDDFFDLGGIRCWSSGCAGRSSVTGGWPWSTRSCGPPPGWALWRRCWTTRSPPSATNGPRADG